MSEADGNAKAHEATTNSIISLDEFTSFASRQKQPVSDIPEFARITLTTMDDMREALEPIKAQAYFDWTNSHGVRFGELELVRIERERRSAMIGARRHSSAAHLVVGSLPVAPAG